MNFDDLGAQMHRFETLLDQNYWRATDIVARLDGRGFIRLTKIQMEFERPLDERFHVQMTHTVEHLMANGFRITQACTQRDESSPVFKGDGRTLGRNARSVHSAPVGEASAAFSITPGQAFRPSAPSEPLIFSMCGSP